MHEEERIERMKELFDQKDYLDPEITGYVKEHFESPLNMHLDIREHYTHSVYGFSDMVSHDIHRNFTFLGIRKKGTHEGEPCLILVSYSGIRYRPYSSSSWVDLS